MGNVAGDAARAAQMLQALNAKLDAYEKILATQKYLAGDVCSVFPHIC
jgi:hypothetical protein